jgi:DNA-binding NarL/FixJ family response regulator
VGIVDDDPWVREGRAVALDRTGCVTMVACVDHRGALARARWDDVDVLLVDAHDPTAGFDQFAGVRVVERVRRERSPAETRIVVLSGHAFNDLLRIRMAEAGADALYPHAEVQTVEALLGVIHGTTPTGEAGSEAARRRVGLAADARLNDAVSWAEDHLGAEALNAQPQKNLEVTRRRLITARSRIAGMVGMAPSADGRRTPEWKEIVRFLQRARGAERRSE